MTKEVFRVYASEVAGLGKLADRIGQQTLASHRYIDEHAGLSETIPGQVLQRLAPFIAHYQEYTRSRHVHLSANCCYIGDELRKAAWLYVDLEEKNYDALNAHTDLIPVPVPQPGTSESPAVGAVEDYPTPVDYGGPSGIDYPPPNPAVDETREVIDDAAESLENGVRRVDEYWDGLAAQAFSDYSQRQVAAMYWEGPCGRTIHALSEIITEQIKNGVRTVVGKLAEMLEAEVDLGSGRSAMKVALKKVPFVGTAWQVASIVEIIWKTMDLTMDLVRRIEDAVDQFGRFLDAITDPEGQISRRIEHHLEPFNQALDRGKMAVDTAKTADITPVVLTPDEKFSVGEGTAPWQDA